MKKKFAEIAMLIVAILTIMVTVGITFIPEHAVSIIHLVIAVLGAVILWLVPNATQTPAPAPTPGSAHTTIPTIWYNPPYSSGLSPTPAPVPVIHLPTGPEVPPVQLVTDPNATGPNVTDPKIAGN